MKLSFSTKGWHNSTFDDFIDIAEDLKFQGIELHNINNRLFTDKDGAFHDYAAAATLRKLYEKKLEIPCIDAILDLGATESAKETVLEIERCLNIAENLHIPSIRMRAFEGGSVDTVKKIISAVLPKAEEIGVTLLIETSGIFSSTKDLREVLDYFASDNLAALWQMSAAYFGCGESSEDIVKNLGKYIKHVQFNDAVKTDNSVEYCLAGEGEMPIADFMLTLRSVNYDGYISLVWDPAWCEELDDMEISSHSSLTI